MKRNPSRRSTDHSLRSLICSFGRNWITSAVRSVHVYVSTKYCVWSWRSRVSLWTSVLFFCFVFLSLMFLHCFKVPVVWIGEILLCSSLIWFTQTTFLRFTIVRFTSPSVTVGFSSLQVTVTDGFEAVESGTRDLWSGLLILTRWRGHFIIVFIAFRVHWEGQTCFQLFASSTES